MVQRSWQYKEKQGCHWPAACGNKCWAQLDELATTAHKESSGAEENSSTIVGPRWRILKMTLLPRLLFGLCLGEDDHNRKKGCSPDAIFLLHSSLVIPFFHCYLCPSFPYRSHFPLQYTVYITSSLILSVPLFHSPSLNCILYCVFTPYLPCFFTSLIFSLPQRSWTRWCTVRLCVWMPSRPGGTTMMSTVCTDTLWYWPLRSECIPSQW